MSAIRPESVHVIAQHCGLAALPDDAADAIARDAEHRLRQVVQEAAKFMRHSKRSTLAADDAVHSLRLLGLTSVYGNAASGPLQFTRLAPGVFQVQDPVIDLSAVVAAALPLAPLAPTVARHWLVVNGVQPHIPENPPPLTAGASAALNLGTDASGGGGGGPSVGKRASAVAGTKRKRPVAAGVEVHPPEDADVEVTGRVHHQLSRELQVYFNKVIKAIRASDDTASMVLRTLRVHSGLHQLVPYFCQFIPHEINTNLRNLRVLWMLLRAAEALLANKHIQSQLEHYLHQLIPALLSCVVSRRLCELPDVEDHWALRGFAARLVSQVCDQYGDVYPSLRPRIIKTLFGAFCDTSKPHTTHYGAIVGISAMGARVFEDLLLPRCVEYVTRLHKHLQPRAPPKSAKKARKVMLKRIAVAHCMDAMLRAASGFLRSSIVVGTGAAPDVCADALLAAITATPLTGRSAGPTLGTLSSPTAPTPLAGAAVRGDKKAVQDRGARLVAKMTANAGRSHATVALPRRARAGKKGKPGAAGKGRSNGRALGAGGTNGTGHSAANGTGHPAGAGAGAPATIDPPASESESRMLELETALSDVCGEAALPYVSAALPESRLTSFVL